MIKIAAEQIVTVSATGQTSVEIWTTKLDHNIDKPIIAINIPRQNNDVESEVPPVTYLIDIGRVKEAVSVQGYLIDEETSSALTKKINLRKIVFYEKEITVTWGTGANRQQTYQGNILKVGFSETAGIVGEGQPTGYEQEKNISVQLSLVVGEKKS